MSAVFIYCIIFWDKHSAVAFRIYTVRLNENKIHPKEKEIHRRGKDGGAERHICVRKHLLSLRAKCIYPGMFMNLVLVNQ